MNNDRIGARLRSALGHAFGAETVIAGEAGYDDARRVWNGAVDRHPAMVAFCRTSSEVAAAVLAAREVGVPLSVRGGGHQVAGLSVCDNGLTIDLSTMCAVSVDGGISHAGGGSLLRHVDTANAQAGVVVPAGVVSHTGLGGLALGGGFGWTFRNFGLTCDNIVGAEVVTADGRIVQAGEQDDADLLWALRGGGGNFGVVTRFDLGGVSGLAKFCAPGKPAWDAARGYFAEQCENSSQWSGGIVVYPTFDSPKILPGGFKLPDDLVDNDVARGQKLILVQY